MTETEISRSRLLYKNTQKQERKERKKESLKKLSKVLGLFSLAGMSGIGIGEITRQLWPELGESIRDAKATIAGTKERELSIEEVKLTGLEGFDKRMSAEEIRTILKETFPSKWLRYVKSIEQSNENKLVGSAYGQNLSSSKAVASCYCQNSEIPDKKIVFHKSAKEESAAFLLLTISHEIAHAHMASMTGSQRQKLKQAIGERLLSPDKFTSSYVEKIKNEDKLLETTIKTMEYWAVIVEIFFTDPNQLHIKDFLIVANELKQSDPSFNYLKALERRRELARDTKEQDLFATISHKENPEDPNSFKITFKHRGENYEMTIPLNMPYESFLISTSGSKQAYAHSYKFKFEDQKSGHFFLELEVIPSADSNLIKIILGLESRNDVPDSQIVDINNLGGEITSGTGGQIASDLVEEKTFVEKTLVPLFKDENKN